MPGRWMCLLVGAVCGAVGWPSLSWAESQGRPVLESGSVAIEAVEPERVRMKKEDRQRFDSDPANLRRSMEFSVSWSDVPLMAPLTLYLEDGRYHSLASNGCPAMVSGGGVCTVMVAYEGPAGMALFDGLVAEVSGIDLAHHPVWAHTTEETEIHAPLALVPEASVLSGDVNLATQDKAQLVVVLRNDGLLPKPLSRFVLSAEPASPGTWNSTGGTCAWRTLAFEETCTITWEVVPLLDGTYKGDLYVQSANVFAGSDAPFLRLEDSVSPLPENSTFVATLLVEAHGGRKPGAPDALRPGSLCPSKGERPEVLVVYNRGEPTDAARFQTYQCTLVEGEGGVLHCASETESGVATYVLQETGWTVELERGRLFTPEIACENGIITRTTHLYPEPRSKPRTSVR